MGRWGTALLELRAASHSHVSRAVRRHLFPFSTQSALNSCNLSLGDGTIFLHQKCRSVWRNSGYFK